MNTKLTLVLDTEIIKKAKIFAKTNSTSLSKLFESYLRSIFEKNNLMSELPPLTKRLAGSIPYDSDKSDKELLEDALIEKHL